MGETIEGDDRGFAALGEFDALMEDGVIGARTIRMELVVFVVARFRVFLQALAELRDALATVLRAEAVQGIRVF